MSTFQYTVMRGRQGCISMFAMASIGRTLFRPLLLDTNLSTAFHIRPAPLRNLSVYGGPSLIEHYKSQSSLPKSINFSSLDMEMTGDVNRIRQGLEANENLHQTLLASIKLLEKKSAPEPTASACHLLSFALKDVFRWEDNGFAVLLNILDDKNYDESLSNRSLTSQELHFFAEMIERRIAKEPLQYIIGQWDFYDSVLKVRAPCLCPRPETEELVEHTAGDIKRMIQALRAQENKRKLRVIDIGCGTGAIGISLAKIFEDDVEVFAIDVEQAAIDLSKENAEFVLGENQVQYHKPILCAAGDFSNEKNAIYSFEYDVVVSNPPYIPSKDMETLSFDVVNFEDNGALHGGDDGLDVVRDILLRLPEWCKTSEDRPFEPVCWMEVDTSHPNLIEAVTKDDEHIEFIESLQDFGGLDRFVKLTVKL